MLSKPRCWSYHGIFWASSCFTTLSGYPPWIPMTSARDTLDKQSGSHQYTPNVSIYIPYMDSMGMVPNGLGCPSTLRCLWVSSVSASARDPRCTRRRSWRHSWHVGDHPREGVETLREHVRTMSMIKVARAGQNSLPWGFKSSMFLP